MDALLIEAEKLVDEADAASRKERVAREARRLKTLAEQKARDDERARLKAAADARLKVMYETQAPKAVITGHGLVVTITLVHLDPLMSDMAREGVRRVTEYFRTLFMEQTGLVRGDKRLDVTSARKRVRLFVQDDLRLLLKAAPQLVSIEDRSK